MQGASSTALSRQDGWRNAVSGLVGATASDASGGALVLRVRRGAAVCAYVRYSLESGNRHAMVTETNTIAASTMKRTV